MLLDSLAKFCHLHGRSEQVHLSAVKSADRSVIHISSKTFKNPLELPDYHFFFGVMEFPAFIVPLERKQRCQHTHPADKHETHWNYFTEQTEFICNTKR